MCKATGWRRARCNIARDEIPLVISWSKTTNLEAEKAKLEDFDDESARADELATAFDLFVAF